MSGTASRITPRSSPASTPPACWRSLARFRFQPDRQERRIPFPFENPARDRLTATRPSRQAVRAVTACEDESGDTIDRTTQRKPVE
jgi:hypothetical protein